MRKDLLWQCESRRTKDLRSRYFHNIESYSTSKEIERPQEQVLETKKRQAVEQYIYDPMFVKIAFICLCTFKWRCMGRGLDRFILNSGKWNVTEVPEKRFFVLIPVSFIIYTLS